MTRREVRAGLIRVAVVYVILCVTIMLLQRSMLYHPPKEPQLVPAAYQLEMEEVTFTTQDHIRIAGWFHPPAAGGYTVLFLHGNAGHLGHRAERFKEFIKAGYGLLGFSYRGYGKSEGAPGEQGFYHDAEAALEFLKQKNIPQDKIIYYGESLGTGVASYLAVRTPPAALVLEVPYTSIADVAQDIYWFLPVRLLLWDRFDTFSRLSDIHAPTLVVHGRMDTVIPFSHGEKIYAALGLPKQSFFPEQTGHYGHDMKIILEKLKTLLNAPRSSGASPHAAGG